MPMKERRRLADEAKAIIAETRRATKELAECVARSRELLDESKQLLARAGWVHLGVAHYPIKEKGAD